MTKGQPPKYNEARVKVICDHLGKMASKIDACKAAGVSPKTFSFWYKHHPEFKERIDNINYEVMETGKVIAIAAIFTAMPKNWTAAAWWLERNFPEQYGKRDNFTGNITHEVKQLNINVPDSETKYIMKEHMKRIKDEETKQLMQNGEKEEPSENDDNE